MKLKKEEKSFLRKVFSHKGSKALNFNEITKLKYNALWIFVSWCPGDISLFWVFGEYSKKYL